MYIIPVGTNVLIKSYDPEQPDRTGKLIANTVVEQRVQGIVELDAQYQFWDEDKKFFTSRIVVDYHVIKDPTWKDQR